MTRVALTKKKVIVLIGLIWLGLWPSLLIFIFPEYQKNLLPTAIDQVAGYLSILLLLYIRSSILVLVSSIWVGWYFIGTLNVVSSSLIYGDYYSNLDITGATQIYFLGCFAFITGIYCYERFVSKLRLTNFQYSIPINTLGPVSEFLLIIFPILWVVSLYLTLGGIPVLSGDDITAGIYNTYYGPLYPYTVILVLCALYALYLHTGRGITYSMGLIYALFITAISIADGKRFTLVLIMLSSIPLVFKYNKEKVWRYTGLMSIALLALYVMILILRQGGVKQDYLFESIKGFMLVGVEFRDFVYSVNYYQPGEIPGYSWLESAIGAMGNNFLMDSLGINKANLVHTGSAFAWSDMFGSPYGVRTGIVSETWFAYGYYYVGIIFTFGLITGIVTSKAIRSRNVTSLLFWSGTFGLLLSSIVGQTTSTTGSLIVFIYVLILLAVERLYLSNFKIHRVGRLRTT